MSVLYGAPELCTVLFGVCIAVFGIWYTPWDNYDYLRNHRELFGAVRFVVLSCFVTAISILMIIGYQDWLMFTTAATGILSLITYRSILELIYQRTGDKSILSKFV